MKKLLKLLVIAGLVMGVVGCASVGGVANKMVNNQNEGVIFGANLGEDVPATFCNLINNKDERCNEPNKYKTLTIASKIGYAYGFTGIIAFAPIDMDTGVKECRSGSNNCTYFKVKVEKNKLGTVLEVASRPNEGKCYWSGMPRIGGTVCPAYGYDYRKDFTGVVR